MVGFSEERMTAFKDHRTRLNKFFMCFVSDIVFGKEEDPDGEILTWLLECITCRSATGDATRQFSLFNSADVVDPTPVLRSFLLKLLLQIADSDVVQHYLDNMMRSWMENKNYQLQTMVLLMDCRKVCRQVPIYIIIS